MINKRQVILCVFAFTLIAGSNCFFKKACGPNCSECSSFGCKVCHKATYNEDAKKCTDPAQDGCLFSHKSGVCKWCEPGKYLNFETKQCFTPEADKLIANCKYGMVSKGLYLCDVCDNGMVPPEFINSRCGTKNAIDNCVLTGLDYKRNPECLKCKSGFLSVGDKCKQSSKVGCAQTLQLFGSGCDICDWENGYFMTKSDKCEKA